MTSVIKNVEMLSFPCESLEFITLSSQFSVYCLKQYSSSKKVNMLYGIARTTELENWTVESNSPLTNILETGVPLSELTGCPSSLDTLGTVTLINPMKAMNLYAHQFTFKEAKHFLAMNACDAQHLFYYLKNIQNAHTSSRLLASSIPPNRLILIWFKDSDVLLTTSGVPLLWLGSAITVSIAGSATDIEKWLSKARATNALLSVKRIETPQNQKVRLVLRVNETLRQELLKWTFIAMKEGSAMKSWKELTADWLTAP